MPPPLNLPQDTLDLLLLKTFDLQLMHGWAIVHIRHSEASLLRTSL